MNVLLLALDTLRADHLSCYGYSRKTSPNIDKLALKGVLFERCYAPDIPTQPAYTTIYTSRYGLEHGIVSHGAEEQTLPRDFKIFTELLQNAGFTTVAVDNLAVMKPWFTRGYEYYICPPKPLQFLTADEVNDRAIRWLKFYRDKQPFFMFLHYWDPHTPYIPPKEYMKLFYEGNERDPRKASSMEPFKKSPFYHLMKRWMLELLPEVTDIEYISSLYDSEIKYLDDRLGELFDALDELELLDETLIIITADHGESLTEHGIFFDHHGVYENTIHVPLILYSEEILPKGIKVPHFVEHVDIAPTILETVGLEIPEWMRGRSLFEVVRGKAPPRRFVVCGECTYEARRAIVTEEWKLIKTYGGDLYNRPRIELYNLRRDPQEEKNVAEDFPEVVNELELQMTRWIESILGEKPDPIRVQLGRYLPGHQWLKRALESEGIPWEKWFERQRYI
ncbi:MAG: sulfatase [Thermoprotei archaeon]|nr:MAG: sulfatase [Thermoprotei archaeon]